MSHCLVQILDGIGMEDGTDGHAGGKRSLSPVVALQRSSWEYARSRRLSKPKCIRFLEKAHAGVRINCTRRVKKEAPSVARTMTRRTEEIRNGVSSLLSSDSRVNGSRISVHAASGRVVLSGTVPSYPDRLWAEDDAYAIPGVSYVENRLEVRPPDASSTPDDNEIAGRIRSALTWNPSIDANRIEVSVENGVVTLSGTVATIWQRSVACETAGNTRGVLDMRSHLSVEPDEKIPDRDIARQLRGMIGKSAFIDPCMINVHVRNGVVTLSGTVHSHHAVRAAEEMAGSIAGVRDINNYLVIA